MTTVTQKQKTEDKRLSDGPVQMAGGALLGFIAMALPLQPKLSLALVMLAGGCLAMLARRASKKSTGRLTRLEQ